MAEDRFPAITVVFLPNYLGVYQIGDVKVDPGQHAAWDPPSNNLMEVLLRQGDHDLVQRPCELVGPLIELRNLRPSVDADVEGLRQRVSAAVHIWHLDSVLLFAVDVEFADAAEYLGGLEVELDVDFALWKRLGLKGVEDSIEVVVIEVDPTALDEHA